VGLTKKAGQRRRECRFESLSCENLKRRAGGSFFFVLIFWFFFIKEKELGPCGYEQAGVNLRTHLPIGRLLRASQ